MLDNKKKFWYHSIIEIKENKQMVIKLGFCKEKV